MTVGRDYREMGIYLRFHRYRQWAIAAAFAITTPDRNDCENGLLCLAPEMGIGLG